MPFRYVLVWLVSQLLAFAAGLRAAVDCIVVAAGLEAAVDCVVVAAGLEAAVDCIAAGL